MICLPATCTSPLLWIFSKARTKHVNTYKRNRKIYPVVIISWMQSLFRVLPPTTHTKITLSCLGTKRVTNVQYAMYSTYGSRAVSFLYIYFVQSCFFLVLFKPEYRKQRRRLVGIFDLMSVTLGIDKWIGYKLYHSVPGKPLSQMRRSKSVGGRQGEGVTTLTDFKLV